MGGTMDLNDLPIFARVATTKSVSRAARELGIPKSTVSRRVSALEERLGVRLLGRSHKSIALTAAGETFFARVSPLLAALDESAKAAAIDDGAASGKVRVSIPYDFGVARGGALIAAFMAQHPEIDVELFLADRQVDLASEGFDVALRIGALHDKSVVAKKLGVMAGQLVASPAYVRRRGAPEHPAELASHDCVVFNSPPFDRHWRLTGPQGAIVDVEARARLAANALPVVAGAAVAGIGIARVPEYAVTGALASKTLVRVLPEWTTGERPVFVVFASTRHVPARVRALVDFAVKNADLAIHGQQQRKPVESSV
ncbi:MAG TPA: LysR family transcriptional regulator [Polyangiaceae bacterium]